jgi:hypothetical protein
MVQSRLRATKFSAEFRCRALQQSTEIRAMFLEIELKLKNNFGVVPWAQGQLIDKKNSRDIFTI